MYEVEDEGGYHFLKTHRKICCLILYDGGFVVVEGEGMGEEMVGRGRKEESTLPQPCVVAGECWRRRYGVGGV